MGKQGSALANDLILHSEEVVSKVNKSWRKIYIT